LQELLKNNIFAGIKELSASLGQRTENNEKNGEAESRKWRQKFKNKH